MGGASSWTGPVLVLVVIAIFAYKKFLISGSKNNLKDAVRHFKDRK